MQSRHYIVALVVAALSTAHFLYGFIDSRWPVWGLFRQFDRYDYALVDAAGKSFRLRDFVQHRAYVTCDHHLVYLIGGWLVESGNAQPPLWGRVSVWPTYGPPQMHEFSIRLVDGRAATSFIDRTPRP